VLFVDGLAARPAPPRVCRQRWAGCGEHLAHPQCRSATGAGPSATPSAPSASPSVMPSASPSSSPAHCPRVTELVAGSGPSALAPGGTSGGGPSSSPSAVPSASPSEGPSGSPSVVPVLLPVLLALSRWLPALLPVLARRQSEFRSQRWPQWLPSAVECCLALLGSDPACTWLTPTSAGPSVAPSASSLEPAPLSASPALLQCLA
jgi:hypothetical protein